MNGHEQLSLDAPAEAAAPPEGMEIRVRANGGGGRPGPTLEQAEAIGNRDRDVFLEAGAGTGKTRVLVERYCDAIAVDGVEPERILAFTFTEKAAAEMRRRVRVELSRRAAAAAEQSERARLQAAARTGEAAPITTIHGFCRRLLASHPVAAGLDPRFRVLDADEAGRLARTCFGEVLTELAGDDDAVALTAAGYRSRLGSIVLAAHSELRNRGILDPELPEIAISAIDGRDEPATPAEIAAVGGGYEALRKLVAAFSARFDERKAERSAVDFDDLQLLAVDLLRRNRTIAEAQRARFDHLLVDEFQDTSPIQVELVRMLAGPETSTFTVGDAAQSIYGFRGADLASFRRVRDELAAGAGPRPTAMLGLTGSFRSTPDVLAMVNLIGAELLPDFNPLAVGREPAPVGGPDGPAVELLLTASSGWGDEEEGRSSRPSPRRRRRDGWPRPGRSRRGSASSPRAESIRDRWCCCCGRSPTSTPTPRRSSWPASIPTSSAAAATGPRSRSPMPSACSAAWPTPSTTSPCSAPSPLRRRRSRRTGSGCCGGSPAAGSSGARSRRSLPARRSRRAKAARRRDARSSGAGAPTSRPTTATG